MKHELAIFVSMACMLVFNTKYMSTCQDDTYERRINMLLVVASYICAMYHTIVLATSSHKEAEPVFEPV